MSENLSHEGLSVITVATKPGAYYKVFLQSCQRHQIKPVVLGVGAPWRGFCTKLNLVYRHLTQSNPTPYTLYVDGHDTIFQSGLPEIWRTYQGFHSPLVVCADMWSWPDESLKHKFPPSPTKMRYLNAGCFMGETNVLVRALGLMGCPFQDEAQNDQDKFSRYFLGHLDEIKLDYHSELFHNLYCAEELVGYRMPDRAYIYRGSGKKPHILHLAGNVKSNPSYAKNLGYTLI